MIQTILLLNNQSDECALVWALSNLGVRWDAATLTSTFKFTGYLLLSQQLWASKSHRDNPALKGMQRNLLLKQWTTLSWELLQSPADTDYRLVSPESLKHQTADSAVAIRCGTPGCLGVQFGKRRDTVFMFRLLVLTPCQVLVSLPTLGKAQVSV